MTIALNLTVDRGAFRMQAELVLPGRGITALFGPSGSGKTTLLRAIAGLERHPGAIMVNGTAWQDDRQRLFLPTHRRALGYVFQEASLLAHLSVQDNLRFGWRRIAPAARKVEWERTLALLGIEHLLERHPGGLSGGERQRVAIARALLSSPTLLLMDEPLASLDAARKAEVLPYLERLHQDLALPIIYVSHSADEVARLADHLVLIGAGGVLAHGPMSEISARIDLPPELDISGAVVEGEVVSVDDAYRMLQVRCCGATIALVHDALAPGSRLRIRVLARDVSLSHGAHNDTSVLNQLPAEVIATRPAAQDGHVLVRLDAHGLPLVARITRQSHDRLRLAPGMRVWAQFKAAAVLSSGQG